MSDDSEVKDYAEIPLDKGKKIITIKAIAGDKDKDDLGLTDFSKEELEQILIDIADREFQKELESLKKQYPDVDPLLFEMVDTPSKLEKLKSKLENIPKTKRSTQYRKSPSGKVKMANYNQGQTDDVSNWYYKEFDSQKDLIDFLYEKAEKGTAREKKEAEKILNQLFKKLKSVGKINYKGSED